MSTNLNFIDSINRIVNINDGNSKNATHNNIHADIYFDMSNENNSSSSAFSQDDGDNDSISLNSFADLSELDNLLDDLYKAKKNLAISNSIDGSTTALNHHKRHQNHQNNFESTRTVPTLDGLVLDDRDEKLTRFSNNKDLSTTPTTSTSSSPTSLKSSSQLNHPYVSSSSSSSTISSSQSYYNNNMGRLQNNAGPVLSAFPSIGQKNNGLVTQKSGSNNQLVNTRKSVERLIDLINDDNLTVNRSNKTSESSSVSQELENLMSSLSMYKNKDEIVSIANSNKASKNNSSFLVKNNEETPTSQAMSSANRLLQESSPRLIPDKNKCAECHEQIVGQVITALGLIWHPEHFKCTCCLCLIGTNIFYEKDLQPFCEVCYVKLFSPKCNACNKPILDKMLTALNRQWHLECFSCHSCSINLSDDCFLEINDFAYCKNCYVNELAPKCKKCNNAIVENFISALDSYWHPRCFVCFECGMGFNTSTFYEHSNMPYCEFHYHQKRGSLCNSCQQPISGRCVSALGKKYHPEHFNCSFCLRSLDKGTFKESAEKPYCHSCFLKLFPS